MIPWACRQTETKQGREYLQDQNKLRTISLTEESTEMLGHDLMPEHVMQARRPRHQIQPTCTKMQYICQQILSGETDVVESKCMYLPAAQQHATLNDPRLMTWNAQQAAPASGFKNGAEGECGDAMNVTNMSIVGRGGDEDDTLELSSFRHFSHGHTLSFFDAATSDEARVEEWERSGAEEAVRHVDCSGGKSARQEACSAAHRAWAPGRNIISGAQEAGPHPGMEKVSARQVQEASIKRNSRRVALRQELHGLLQDLVGVDAARASDRKGCTEKEEEREEVAWADTEAMMQPGTTVSFN